MNADLRDDPRSSIRRATAGDALACAQLLLMASHGMAEAVFRDLIPGQPTEQIIATRRIEPEGRSSSYTHWWVADGDHSDIAGGINAYALKDNFRPAREELLTEERIRILRPMLELDAVATGTFFINVLAVFPEYRHVGLGRRLIALAVQKARQAGTAAVSLTTFEEDSRLVSYYREIGFTTIAARPIQPHECLQAGGNLVLMAMPIDREGAPGRSAAA
jgi:ribosomal protein S18 acetylase RimI-like enzyme